MTPKEAEEAAAFKRWEDSLQPGERSRADYEAMLEREAAAEAERASFTIPTGRDK